MSHDPRERHLYKDLTSDWHWAMVLKVYPALSWVFTQVMMLMALGVAIPNKNTILFIILAAGYLGSVAVWHYTVEPPQAWL